MLGSSCCLGVWWQEGACVPIRRLLCDTGYRWSRFAAVRWNMAASLSLVVAVATGCLPPRAPSSGAGPGNFQPVKHGVALVLVSLCVVP